MVESLFPTSFVALGELCVRGTVEGRKLPVTGSPLPSSMSLHLVSNLATVYSISD